MGNDLVSPVRTGVILLAFLVGFATNLIAKKAQSWMTSLSVNQKNHYSQVEQVLLEDELYSFKPNPQPLPLSPVRVKPHGYRFPASKTMKRAIAQLNQKKKKGRNFKNIKFASRKIGN